MKNVIKADPIPAPPLGNPYGFLDEVTPIPDQASVRVRGWAIDPDTSNSIAVHTYIDGAYVGATTANVSRPDVGAAYPGYGNNHGYDVQYAIGSGSHQVCTYAINTGAGDTNPQLPYCRTVQGPQPPRVASLDSDHKLWIKEGAIGATWTPVATNVDKFQLSLNRIAILQGSTLAVKEGALGAEWVTVGTGVSAFRVTDNRVGALFGSKLSVKEGPLDAGWITMSTGVTDFDMSPNRIAVLDSNGHLSVKEGGIGAGWTNDVAVSVGVGKFHITDGRVGVLWGTDLNIKDGPLGATWTVVINPTSDFQLSPNRIMAKQADGTLWVKEGAIGAGWTMVSGGADGFSVSDTRVDVWGGGNMFVKDGPIGATWTPVSSNSIAGALSQ